MLASEYQEELGSSISKVKEWLKSRYFGYWNFSCIGSGERGSPSLQALGKPWAQEPCSGSWSCWEKTECASSRSHQVCEQTSAALLIWNTKHIRQSRSWWKPSYTCPGLLKSVSKRAQCMAGLSHLLKYSMSADSRIRDCRWDTAAW